MAFNEQQVMNDPVNVGIAGLESGGDYSAKNPESTASGKYQFIEDTFLGVQKNNPDLPKVNFEQFKKDPQSMTYSQGAGGRKYVEPKSADYDTKFKNYAKGGVVINKGIGASMKPHNVFGSKGKK
jgi:hypothetical protein